MLCRNSMRMENETRNNKTAYYDLHIVYTTSTRNIFMETRAPGTDDNHKEYLELSQD